MKRRPSTKSNSVRARIAIQYQVQPRGCCRPSYSSLSAFANSRRSFILIIAGLMTGLLLGAMDENHRRYRWSDHNLRPGGTEPLRMGIQRLHPRLRPIAFPIFGKLSDLYGRRRFFILGLLQSSWQGPSPRAPLRT